MGAAGERHPVLRAGGRRGGRRRHPGGASPAASLRDDRRWWPRPACSPRITVGLIQGWATDHDRRQRLARRADGARQRGAGDDRDAAGRVGHPDHHRSHAARAVRSRPAAAPAAGARGARHLGAQPGDGESLRVGLQHHRRERPARPGRLLLPRHRQAGQPGLLRGEPGRRAQPARPDDARWSRRRIIRQPRAGRASPWPRRPHCRRW